MATVDIVKYKIRRGTNAARKLVTLDESEPGFTTDTRRLYFGDGSTPGGLPISPVVFGEVTTFGDPTLADQAEKGDFVYVSSKLYTLTASSHTGASDWKFIGTVPDNTALQYDGSNHLTIANNGVSGNHIDSSVAGNGLNYTGSNLEVVVDNSSIVIVGGVLSAATTGGAGGGSAGSGLNKIVNTFNVVTDGATIQVNGSNQLEVIGLSANSLTSAMVTQGALGPGLTGGNGAFGGSSIRVAVDNNTIIISDGVLSAAPTSVPDGSINENKINSSSFGNGLTGGSGDFISVALDTAAGLTFSGSLLSLAGASVPTNKLANDHTNKITTNGLAFMPAVEVANSGIVTGLTGTNETFTQAESAANAEDLYAVVLGPNGLPYAVQLYTFAGSASYTF